MRRVKDLGGCGEADGGQSSPTESKGGLLKIDRQLTGNEGDHENFRFLWKDQGLLNRKKNQNLPPMGQIKTSAVERVGESQSCRRQEK